MLPGRRWEETMKMDFQDIGFGDVDRIYSGSGQEQVTGSCKHGTDACGYTNKWNFLTS